MMCFDVYFPEKDEQWQLVRSKSHEEQTKTHITIKKPSIWYQAVVAPFVILTMTV
jgi:hypothetical protein